MTKITFWLLTPLILKVKIALKFWKNNGNSTYNFQNSNARQNWLALNYIPDKSATIAGFTTLHAAFIVLQTREVDVDQLWKLNSNNEKVFQISST